MRILAVDDDPFILELLTMISARVGYPDVTTVASGEDMLRMLADPDDRFDCLLVDISMPGMDGIELCQYVRGIPTYRKTPIIMLTAMTEKAYIDRAFKAGATDYVTKPVDFIDLGARLHSAEEIVEAREEAARAAGRRARQAQHSPLANAIDLTDEIRIDGYKDLIEYGALGNYLTQLSRAGLGGLQVLGIKIDGIESIFERASYNEFVYALTEVADAVDSTFGANRYMMGYAGNGVFVLISNKATLESSVGLEAEIQGILDDKNSEYDNGDPMDIEVSIGNPIRPNASKTQRVHKTFDRAIARAESRVLKKRGEVRPVNVRLVSSN